MNSNKKIQEIQNHFMLVEGWDLEAVIEECAKETGMLENDLIGKFALDECEIEWDGNYICVLDEFLKSYTDNFIKKVCSTLESFKSGETAND